MTTTNTATRILPATHQMAIDYWRLVARHKAAEAKGNWSEAAKWRHEMNLQYIAIQRAGYTLS